MADGVGGSPSATADSNGGSRSGSPPATAKPDDPLFVVEGLEKHYPIERGLLRREVGRVRAVDGIDFAVGRGETVGLIGESGCGKSTAARTALRIEEPTAGAVRFDGEDVRGYDPAALRAFRRRATMVFQDPDSTFDPRMTVGESVTEPLAVHGLADPERRRAIATDLLERVGLGAGTFERYPHELSGGQKQRAALSRALVLNPDLLVADEPVSALDVSVQAEILTLLSSLRESFGLSLLVITHDMSVVREICDRVAVMYLGEIVEAGPTERTFEDPKHPYTEALVSSVPTPDPAATGRSRPLGGDVPDPADPPPGCRFHTRCPEVIPPEDVEAPTWRALVDLRVALADEEVSVPELVDEGLTPGALREAFDLPEHLPSADAEASLVDVLSAAAEADVDAALDRFDESFRSPCLSENPEARHPAPDRRVACHLYEDG